MKKLLLIILSTALILFSCVTNERHFKKYKKFTIRAEQATSKRGGAVASHDKENVIKRKARRVKPSESMALGLDKAKTSHLSSIKSQHSSQIAENSEMQHFDMFDDFDSIFVNGRYVGYYKIGNPYEIEGVPYYPQEYDDYEEVGVASWYGEQFDGKMTANGEIYDLSSMTAAHQTLPLPSMAKVTNLENGKSVVVRVNDRGPFAKNRIIDLSKRAAENLDYHKRGTATVKVEYLPEETEKLLASLKIK
ncbi:MAG TPA: septal ring lytic transglycosylase RlpA family protein [Rickettsiales bacterium]|nr:septal ring lytic transglycosylase RlpA family protein [Rickettsiales bacterium]